MTIYFLLVFLVISTYTAMQLVLLYSWQKIPSHRSHGPVQATVSVIIAVRNEAETITQCLKSIANQRFPTDQLEIIVVDNHSDDGTLSICRKLQADIPFKLVDLSSVLPEQMAFKKEALAAGIDQARGEVILTTDGDCIAPRTWVQTMVGYLTENAMKVVTGPVSLEDGVSFVEKYQQLELFGLMVATGGGIRSKVLLLANGANMCFHKETFHEMGGYTDRHEVSSGDDVSLLHEIGLTYPERIGFVKSNEATISTKASTAYRQFFQQRKRWATKAAVYRHKTTKIVAIIVVLNSALLVVGGILALLFGDRFVPAFVLHLVSKILIDTCVIALGSKFFGKAIVLKEILVAQLFNPLANVIVLISALHSREYTWRGRRTR